jgi:hypothetical protein
VQDIRDLSKSETDRGRVSSGLLSTFSKVTIIETGDVVKRHVRVYRNSARKGEKRDLRHKSKRAHSHRSTENLTRGKSPPEAAQQEV